MDLDVRDSSKLSAEFVGRKADLSAILTVPRYLKTMNASYHLVRQRRATARVQPGARERPAVVEDLVRAVTARNEEHGTGRREPVRRYNDDS